MKMTIKSGDTVVVLAGKDKGKTGKVIGVNGDQGRVIVENVNIVSKHQKPRSQEDKGGIIKKSAPIDASNVQVICPVCGKATRVAHSEVDGKKVRTCKKCNASLDKAFAKKTTKKVEKSETSKKTTTKKTTKSTTTKTTKTTKKVDSKKATSEE